MGSHECRVDFSADLPRLKRFTRRPDRDTTAALPGPKARIRDFGVAEFISVPDKRTCVDLRSRGGLRATMSPLVCEAIDNLIEDLHVVRHSTAELVLVPALIKSCVLKDVRPEHVLDDLYRAYLDKRPRIEEPASNAFEIKLRIPAIGVTAVQDVLQSETPSLSPHGGDRDGQRPGFENSMFGVIRLDIIDIAMSYRDLTVSDISTVSLSSRRTVERVLAAHAEQSQLRILRSSTPSVTVPHRTIGTPGLGHDALVLYFRRCEARLDYTLDRVLVGLIGGSATLDFDGEAAGLLIGSLWSWRTLSEVVDTLSARAVDSKLLVRRLLADIAVEGESAGALAVPTFLNRISYLAGASSTTRMDDIWKLLHILRQAHRHSRTSIERPSGIPCPPEEDRDRFLRAISAHANWDLDVADIQASAFVRGVFGDDEGADPIATAPSALFWLHPFALDWTTETFQAHFWHNGRRTNRLALGPTDALIGSSGVLPGADELNIRARLTLHSIASQVDRDLLGLVRHIASVRRTFEDRIKRFQVALRSARGQPAPDSSPSATSLPWASLPPINLSASTAVLRTAMKADAGEVIAEAAGSAIISSVFVHLQPRLEQDGLFTGHSWKVAGTFAAESASLTAAEGGRSRDTLLSAGVVTSLHCLWLEGERAADGQIAVSSTRLNASVGGVKLRVPRDAVRSYQ